MMGAQKARTLVKNHCRHATISSVFFVRIQVWLRIAMVVVVARDGRGRGQNDGLRLLALDSCVDITDYEMEAATLVQRSRGI